MTQVATISLDDITCQKCGTLAAYGLSDLQIRDALLLTEEQLLWAKEQEKYKISFAEKCNERIQNSLDLADGWDAIELKAMENVLMNLAYNRDPKYSLAAAKIANQARRHHERKSEAKVLNVPGSGNVIILQMNKNYIDQRQTGPERASMTIDVKENRNLLPKRQSDVPNPQMVSNMLSPQDKRKGAELDQFREDFYLNGIDMLGNGTES